MLYPHRVSMKTSKSTVLLEPVVGIEPTTYGLRMQSAAFLETLKKRSKCP
jgi:hypothetical protein